AASVAKPSEAKGKKKWDWSGTLDKNSDGKTTEAEWLVWAQTAAPKKKRTFNEKGSKAEFARRDADGDGIITRKELDAGAK
ncbi:MAG: hypothetical protein U9P12_09795, partial [Verrucomicrobiota bacterium]|nr:hypothetical protein [Verrucomicrobiota bacterium]